MQSQTKNQAKYFTTSKHFTAYSIALSLGCILIVAGGWLFIYVWHWQNRSHVLEIYCFKPDNSLTATAMAIFIRTPQGKTVLIDGGKSDSIIHDLTSVMPFYDRTIDTLILTNDDDSHATGIVAVLGRYHVGKVYEMAMPENISTSTISASTTSLIASSSAYTELEKNLVGNIIHKKVREGDSMSVGELSAEVIFPPASADGFKFSKTNPPTLAFSLTYGSTILFFGGLMTKTEQKYIATVMASSSAIMNIVSVLSSTFLILPNGENVSAVDEGFFTAIQPDFVVVSKKPKYATTVSSQSSQKVPKEIVTTTKTGKIKKPPKPPKPPFDISTVSGLSIINLATDGDIEFISNGTNFIEKKL